MAEHAILSPSASHRWLKCTSAPALEMTFPDETSSYAEEGTLAHAICEAKLHELIGDKSAKEYYKAEFGADWTEHTLYKPEMEDTSDYYRDVVAQKLAEQRKRTPDAQLLIEVRLDFSKWLPKGFGTADAVIVGDGEIDVIDYKHGKGVKVDSTSNPQMMIYALGACELFGFDYGIDYVTMTIVQPRIDNTSTWEIPCKVLYKWGDEVLKPKAEEAFGGTLGCVTNTEVGEWCRFCKAKHACKARANAALELIEVSDPRTLSPKEVAEMLPKAESVKDWCTDLNEYALGLMLSGTEIEGYKVVEGRSTRKISDEKGLVKAMVNAGVDKELLYKPQELRTITDLERVVGKKAFTAIANDFIEKPKGKPTIASESDKRERFSTINDDFSHVIDN